MDPHPDLPSVPFSPYEAQSKLKSGEKPPMSVADMTSDLARRAYDHLAETLPNKPLSDHEAALRALLGAFSDGLEGKLEHGLHLASLDPGMGKSMAVSSFLTTWCDLGLQPTGSVLIAVASYAEIHAYIERLGSLADRIGVFVSERAEKDFQSLVTDPQDAPILFTTQQMIKSRSRRTLFKSCPEFHHRGSPRSLLIWDESMDPGDWKVVRLDEVHALPRAVRSRSKPLLEAVQHFQRQLAEAHAGPIDVPEELKAPISFVGLDRETGATLRSLQSMAGQQAYLHHQEDGDHILTFEGATLPDDFSPVVLLDASGRVRETYRLWEKHRGGLHRLPAAPRDYSNLTVHVWQRASGKLELLKEESRYDIAREIVALINSRKTDEWLIVHDKARDDLFENVRGRLKHGGHPEMVRHVRGLTWGRHKADNSFRQIRNVILVGQTHYPPGAYVALAYAAMGRPPRSPSELDMAALRWGELQHQVLQAVCRGAVRNGGSEPCNAYVICMPSSQAKDRLRETFPGATVVDWKLDQAVLDEKQQMALEFLLSRFADPAVEKVPKSEVVAYIGVPSANFGGRIVSKGSFKEALDHFGFAAGHHDFVRVGDRPASDW